MPYIPLITIPTYINKVEIIKHYKEEHSPYYSVQFNFNEKSALLLDQVDEVDEIIWWCYNNFGEGLGNCRIENSPFIYRWIDNIEYGEVLFSDKKDLDWFLLKWN